jgi:hypothetical protein
MDLRSNFEVLKLLVIWTMRIYEVWEIIKFLFKR